MKQIHLWWQRLVAGLIRTPQQLVKEAKQQERSLDGKDTTFSRFSLGLEKIDTIRFEAPERLKAPSLFTSETVLRQHDRANWEYVDPRLMAFTAMLIQALRKQGIPMYVHSAFRTEQEQNAISSKNTRARWPRAPHCQGMAVDIVHSKYHWQLSPQEWALIGKVGKDLAEKLRVPPTDKHRGWSIRWGGDFHINGKPWPDPAHWEVTEWRETILKLESRDPVRLTPRAILRRGLPQPFPNIK